MIHSLLLDFLDIMKRSFQNISKILNKCSDVFSRFRLSTIDSFVIRREEVNSFDMSSTLLCGLNLLC